MRRPKTPPSLTALIEKIKASGRLPAVLSTDQGPLVAGKYLHWDSLLHRSPPEGLLHEEWWFAVTWSRRHLSKPVPLKDKQGRPFKHVNVDPIPESLHNIDLWTGGTVQMPEQITNPETRDRYYVSSLIEEAITSSQLEGASTTRKVAKDMLRAGREPRNKSERMIFNNYKTMRRIGELKEDPLTQNMVLQLHGLVTEGTLDDPSEAGRLRNADEPVAVYNNDDGEIAHTPPPAEQLEERMGILCDFANGETPHHFIHPVVRSIMLHFWLAYDHPFVDGNGRTARALFYWSMLHHKFWLFEFISISEILLKAPSKYGRAFLHTETDDNDLTYFILHQLDVIQRAVGALLDYIKRKTKQLQEAERKLHKMQSLNHRQRVLISHALRHPQGRYTIESHSTSHNVVYQTGRTDLLNLKDRGLLECTKIGRTLYFTPADALEDKLREA